MQDIFTTIGQKAAQQATLLLSQETFGMVETMAFVRVDEAEADGAAFFTLRWQALSMGVSLCDVAMVLLPEFLDADDNSQAGLIDQVASYLVENTVEKLREAADEEE